MIIPSIDLMGGHAVQLIGGETQEIDAGDPFPIAERFSMVGEIAVIDLDAAMGQGSNAELIHQLVKRFPCRVGGGIRDVDTAIRWLDAGAHKVILGTAATPEVLTQLPRDRVIAAVDGRHGSVVTEGWKHDSGVGVLDKIGELRDCVGGFLVTFVETEGRMEGIDLDRVAEVVKTAGDVRVTVAGGVTTGEEIRAIDDLGADAQVGMALYTGRLSLADALLALLRTDREDGLFPTIICDEHGVALGLAYSSKESIALALEERIGVYHSRKRGLWRKGGTSGATQDLLRVDLDCDRDALRFTVNQKGGGFCHLGTWTCWGEEGGLRGLERILQDRISHPVPGSYTARLLRDPDLLRSKITEEAEELVIASGAEEVAHEAADVIYFTLIKVLQEGGRLIDVVHELDRRSKRVTRRPGDKKS
jgi:phosphoribosyl-ATP pyrophosphohydrolase